MNGAELMVAALESEGVSHVFGVPGEENEDLLFALEQSTVAFVPVRHEQGGAFIANVIGRLTGKAGVCLSTLGPGATNLATGLADANLDKSPVVAITGQGEVARIHHESHQMLDVVSLMKHISKWSSSIYEIGAIPEIVRKAFKLAELEKPGVTHIELPENIAKEEYKDHFEPLLASEILPSIPSQAGMTQLIEVLKKSSRPLVIAGNGCIRQKASSHLRDWIEQCNVPVATTFMAKGVVSDKSDLCLGAIGLGFKDYVIEACERADTILCVGYDIAEYDPMHWNRNRDKVIIHIDTEPAEVFEHYMPKIELVGDIAETLKVLSERMTDFLFDDFTSDIKKNVEDSRNQFRIDEKDKYLHVPGVLHEIRKVLPDDGLLISDVGSHKMWIARNFHTYVPNGCIISNGMASMGISLPGAIASHIVDPQRHTVALMGDGGAMMNIQELETAARLGISATIIIFNDNNYGLIEWKQEMSEGKSFGTKLTNPNFKLLAQSFGIDGHTANDVDELRAVLQSTITSDKLSVIEIPITTEVNEQLTQELEHYFNKK